MANPFGLDDASKERFQSLFKGPVKEHPERWDQMWASGEFLPWDRGLPNPALVDTLKDKTSILGPPIHEAATGKPRKKALVPGCGAGYDVLLLAATGYDCIGLEVSDNALKRCEALAKDSWDKYAAESGAHGPGSFKFVKGDFFTDEWRDDLSGFDLIYDYTFFCALPHEARPAWAKRQSEILAPEGKLVCLEFPTGKPGTLPGPPFGLKPETYIAHLTDPGNEIPYTAERNPEPSTYSEEAVAKSTNKLALKRIAHWKPERTHSVGQGTDFVSIWGHK